MANRSSRSKSVYMEKHNDSFDVDYNTRMNTIINETPGIRVGGRQKKAKAIFDPSDYQVPNNKRKKDADDSFKEDKVTRTPSKRQSDIVHVQSPSKSVIASSLASTIKCISCQKTKSYNNETKLKDCSGSINCHNKIHALCLEKEKKKRQCQNQWHVNDTWICEECLKCCICKLKKETIALFTCTKCEKSYHPHCHNPKFSLKLPSRIEWRCKQCTIETEVVKEEVLSPRRIQPVPTKAPTKVISTRKIEQPKANLFKDIIKETAMAKRINKLTGFDTEGETNFNGFSEAEIAQDNFINDSDDCDSGFLCDIKENNSSAVADVSKWTFNDVFKYFYKHFGNDALIFKEQEIDGTCIMVMKRSDVIPGFQNGTALKLGTLLKMYNHILSFQTKIRSPSLSWK
ncbi:unnamed protein product [Diamesa serratosioi]